MIESVLGLIPATSKCFFRGYKVVGRNQPKQLQGLSRENSLAVPSSNMEIRARYWQKNVILVLIIFDGTHLTNDGILMFLH